MGLQIRTPAEQHQIVMAPITGTYTQVSSEKYEEFLKALGVGFILRKAALASTPVMTISEEGGNWTMVTKTTVKSIELKFRIGEEFEEDTTDGRHCKTIVTLDGNVMTTKQNGTKPGDKNVVVVFRSGNDFFDFLYRSEPSFLGTSSHCPKRSSR